MWLQGGQEKRCDAAAAAKKLIESDPTFWAEQLVVLQMPGSAVIVDHAKITHHFTGMVRWQLAARTYSLARRLLLCPHLFRLQAESAMSDCVSRACQICASLLQLQCGLVRLFSVCSACPMHCDRHSLPNLCRSCALYVDQHMTTWALHSCESLQPTVFDVSAYSESLPFIACE